MESYNTSGIIYTAEKKRMGMENPFTLKVGQVFTGFGIGCGVGIGVGRPLKLGAIPVLNEVMVATRGATDAFSGVQRHVNSALRKVGTKSIEAGIGCGVGFGHGFGAGIAVRPSVLLQFQSHVLQAVTGIIKKLGMGPTLSANQHILPPSLLTGMDMVKEPSPENTDGSICQLVKSMSNSTSEGNIGDVKRKLSGNTTVPNDSATNIQYSSRTETVIENFLNSPILKDDGSSEKEQGGRQHLKNNMLLQMVLKHQVLIEELMQENEKLRHVLVKELKVQPNKFESSFSRSSTSSCSECFQCRRKQRKR